MLKQLVIIAILTGLIVWASMTLFRRDVGDMLSNNAVRRQVNRLCMEIERGKVSKEEVCSLLPPQIPAMQSFYDHIREKDGAWYADQDSLYYPRVTCSGGEVRLTLLNQKFYCLDGQAAKLNK